MNAFILTNNKRLHSFWLKKYKLITVLFYYSNWNCVRLHAITIILGVSSASFHSELQERGFNKNANAANLTINTYLISLTLNQTQFITCDWTERWIRCIKIVGSRVCDYFISTWNSEHFLSNCLRNKCYM